MNSDPKLVDSTSQASIWRATIAFAYDHFLKRPASEEEITAVQRELEKGLSLESFIRSVATSEEAKFKAAGARARPELADNNLEPSEYISFIRMTYGIFLGRGPEPDTLAERIKNLESGLPLRDMIAEIATSDESIARIRNLVQLRSDEEEQASVWRAAIAFTYSHFLKRFSTDEEMTGYLRSLEGGLSLENFIRSVANSDEAKSKAATAKLQAALSDGEFVARVGQLLYGRGLTPVEVVMGQQFLSDAPTQRQVLVSNMIDERVWKLLQPDKAELAENDPTKCLIMGTGHLLTRQLWEERGRQISDRSLQEMRPPLSDRRFTHSGSFKVSMIASLYKGGDYIRNFLENITSQSTFDSSELIIVDANSPEREWEVIEQYQKVYENIVYKRLNYRISIYEAWNLAVHLARGHYLTNTNLDDLRQGDSIELQAELLDQNADVDVVYQDVYYSFDANLNFDAVAAYGFKTLLPIITPHNLLQFNSPHNAPMWRKSLHAEHGLFDTRYESAGDYDFWLRCILAGKNFRKLNIPHVVYYVNPNGVSTKANTRGLEEGYDLLRRYSSKLTSRTLLLSRRAFITELGVNEEQTAAPRDLSYYDLAQRELVELGARRWQASKGRPAGDK